MKRFREKFLLQGDAANPILATARDGLSPAEFKKQIIVAFSPYFTNQQLLERYAIEFLSAELVNLGKVRAKPVVQAAFDHGRTLYREAERADGDRCYECFAAAEPQIAGGREEFWSVYYLSPPLDTLDLPEFKHEAFRVLGALLESWLQPLLRDQLCQLRISRGRKVQFSDITSLTFGNVVGELHDITQWPLYAPAPWNLRLNQWRNLAQHYRSSLRGEKIIGWYGDPGNEKSIELSREELMTLLHSCVSLFDGFRLARSLFGLDEVEQLKPHLVEIEERPEVAILSLVTAIATQGFETTDIEVSEGRAELWLRDMCGEDRRSRMLHASQFVHALWMNTEAAEIKVHYCEPDGKVAGSFGSMGENCRDYAERRIDLTTYIDRMSFEVFGVTVAPAPPNSA